MSNLRKWADERLPERFWSKVSAHPEGCWLWTAARSRDGYGVFQVSKGVQRGAHRHCYETLVGGVAGELDHLCRVRHCVNPLHLEDVTRAVNAQRGRSHNGEKTHCPRGHEYSGSNLSIKKDGSRRCLACHRTSKSNKLKDRKVETT